MGLNDFVAKEEGFFAAEGLDVDFDWKTFRGTQSSWKGMNYLERPQDKPYTEGQGGGDPGRLRVGLDLQRRAPAWAASWPKPTAIRPGRSSCGRIRRSASRRT